MNYRTKIFFFSVVIISALYNISLPLHPDEAYYWVWSKNLQLSYFDHPPMVAYMIKLFTILGNNEFVVRLVAVISIAVSAYLLYKMALNMFNQRTANITIIIFLLMPLVQSGFIVVTPDSPLVLFWTLSIYFFYRYIFEGDNKSIYLAGIASGFLLLSKYTGILLLISLFLYLLFSEKRFILRKKEVYLAIILALVVFLPVLIWNYHHDWASFKFQYTHGITENKVLKPSLIGEFIAGQMLAFNPVFFLTFFYLSIKHYKSILKSKYLYFLLWPFIFTFLFFMYNGFFERAGANWPGPAYLTAVIILAYLIDKYCAKKLYYISLVLAVVLIVLIRVPELIPFLPEEAVLKGQFYGYPAIMAQAQQYIQPEDQIILSSNYQDASEVWYYLKGNPAVYVITESRFSNYNYWSESVKDDIKNGQIKKAIYLGSIAKEDELKSYFNDVKLLKRLSYEGRYNKIVFYLYNCSN